MSLTPARDDLEAKKKRDAIEKCGKNGGPHDYVPIETIRDMQSSVYQIDRVSRFLCRVCFRSIQTSVLLELYDEIEK